MNYLTKLSFIFVLILTGHQAFAASTSWNFEVPSEYVVSDNSKVKVAGGLGRLKPTITPSLLGNFDTIGAVETTTVSNDGTTLYIADQSNGLQIINISNKANPVFLGAYTTINSNTQKIVLSDDEQIAYVVDSNNGLVILDISNKANPLLIHHYTDTSVNDIALSSDEETAYLVGTFGMVILDISNPAVPVYVNEYNTTPRSLSTVLVSADESTAYIYISGFQAGVYLLDISDPLNITELGEYKFSSSQNMILSADGNTIFSSGSAQGLFIIDVSDSLNPTLIDNYTSAGFVAGIDISSDETIAYLADGSLGLTILDISEPSNPEFMLSFDSSGNARGITVSSDKNYAYLSDSADGVDIISLVTTYPSDQPYINVSIGQVFTSTVDSFIETLGGNNEGALSYKISNDNGLSWYYWDGSDWQFTASSNAAETSAATDINANIASFDTDGGTFVFRVFLDSDGSEKVEIDQVDINYSVPIVIPPTQTSSSSHSSSSGSRRLTQDQINQIFGTTETVNHSNEIRELQLKLISLITQLLAILKG